MKTYCEKSTKAWIICFVSLFGLFALGCTPETESGDANGAGKTLPKLYLHCPDDFAPSVKRLREIFLAWESKEDLPEPTNYRVVEIIHGTGASAHSHYYLANQVPDDDHHHEDQPSDEKFHDVTVELFTEFRDIAYVLPNVAADSDMQEQDWLIVRDASRTLVDLVEGIAGKTDSEKRDSIQQKLAEVDKLLASLESLVPAPEEKQADEGNHF